jgi:Dolichyl-phosphate-mannose-protein mannosyltransferase
VPQRNLVITGLFVMALVPRLLLLALHPDELQGWEYETLAVNIASGQGYVITRFGHLVVAFGDGNLYSFMGGTLYAVLGHLPMVLAVVQAALASAAVPVMYLIAERPFGSAIAALGAALVALHPGLLAYTLKLHPLGLDVLLLGLLVLWSVTRPWSRRDTLVAGLTLGLNLMTRPTYFLAGVAAWLTRWRQHPRDARYLLAAATIAVLIAAPWVIRNWAILGQPLLISTGFEDIWKGNNVAATGSGYVSSGTTIFDVAPARMQVRLWQSDELRVSAVFAEETAEFIRNQPGQFVSLAVRKFFYFWWLPAEAGLLYPVAWLSAYQVYAVVMYAFASVGVLGILRHGTSAERELLTTIASIGLTLALVHALAYVEGRHRWGLEPLILLIAARGMFSVVGWSLDRGIWPQSRMLRRLKER